MDQATSFGFTATKPQETGIRERPMDQRTATNSATPLKLLLVIFAQSEFSGWCKWEDKQKYHWSKADPTEQD